MVVIIIRAIRPDTTIMAMPARIATNCGGVVGPLSLGAIGQVCRHHEQFIGIVLPAECICGCVSQAWQMDRYIWYVGRRCNVERELACD